MPHGLALVLTALAVSAPGCGGEGLELVPVTGKVTFNGEPVDKAEIAFIRDSTVTPSKGPAPAAITTTGPDGSFKLFTRDREGAVPGKYKVTVQKTSRVDMDFPDPLPPEYTDQVDYMRKNNMTPYPLLPKEYSDISFTPLSYEVTDDPDKNTFEIALEGKAPQPPSQPQKYQGAETGVP